MKDRESKGHLETSWPPKGSLARDMTVGEIFECLGGQTGGEIGVAPWRRLHRARLQAAVEFSGPW